MTRADDYRVKLRSLVDWDQYLLQESGLPGPRGNIELAQAVADEGDQKLFERYISYAADQAPVNSQYEFLRFCGIVGLGRLLAEGVAMALQRLGDVNMPQLIAAMRDWSRGTPLEQRYSLDHEGESEKESAGSHGCRVGPRMAWQNRRTSASKLTGS